MTIFDGIAKLFRLQGDKPPTPPLPPTITGTTGTSINLGSSSTSTLDPYGALWLSVEKHLEAFMAQRVASHLKYEPNDVFRLERVQVQAKNPEADSVLSRFLAEFRPDSRRRAFLERLRRTCAKGVSAEHFIDFNRDFEKAELESSDAFLAALHQNISGGYQVILFGEWELEEQESTYGKDYLGASAKAPPLRVEIHDASGQRQVELLSMPVTFGRTPGSQGCEVRGRFVSRRHGVIERDEQGRVWYRDISVNGTYANEVVISSGEQHVLQPGMILRLGAESANSTFADCPALKFDWHNDGINDATPIRVQAKPTEATPIRASSSGQQAIRPSESTSLCLLAVQDAEGSHTVAISTLPYRVGRANNSDYRVPEINLGVSREHLVIERIDQQGVEIHATGKWGTTVNGKAMTGNFRLGFGQTMILASNYADAPTVTLELLRP